MSDLITIQDNSSDEFIHVGSIGSKLTCCGLHLLRSGGQHYETVGEVDCPACLHWPIMARKAEGNTRRRRMIQNATRTARRNATALYAGMMIMATAAFCLWMVS